MQTPNQRARKTRHAAIVAHRLSGKSVADTARFFQVSDATVYNCVKRFTAENPGESPLAKNTRITPEAWSELQERIMTDPAITLRAHQVWLKAAHDISFSYTGLSARLNRHGYSRRDRRQPYTFHGEAIQRKQGVRAVVSPEKTGDGTPTRPIGQEQERARRHLTSTERASIVTYRLASHTAHEAAIAFGVSEHTVHRCVRKAHEAGQITALPPKGGNRWHNPSPFRATLLPYIESRMRSNSKVKLSELQVGLQEMFGVAVKYASLSYYLNIAGYSRRDRRIGWTLHDKPLNTPVTSAI